MRAKRQEVLRNEQRNLNQEIIRWTQKEVFAITRKTLADLAGMGLEDRIGDVFVQRVRAITGEAKEQLATAFKTSNHTVSVHSAFDLPPAQKSAIEKAVKETFAPDAQVQFETAPELVSGIEISSGGHKVAWSIADYLTTLEKSAGELLHKDAKPESKPDANSKPEPKAESKPAPNGEAKSEPKVEAKLEPKGESKPEPKADAKPSPNGEAKSEPKAEAKPEPKVEAKPGPTAAAKPAPKLEPVPSAQKADH